MNAVFIGLTASTTCTFALKQPILFECAYNAPNLPLLVPGLPGNQFETRAHMLAVVVSMVGHG